MNWKHIVRSKLFVEYINPIASMVFWYSILIFVAWETLNLLQLYPIDNDGVNIALPNIISTIGIISAILITFIFSKLYAEKSEIVERKKRIQQLSAKINSIRKICYILFKKNQFWNNQTLLAKYHQFSKLPDQEKVVSNYSDEHGKQLNVLWDLDTIINNIDEDYIIYNKFNTTKYTQKDLVTILNTFDSLLPLMQLNPEEFLNIEEFTRQDQDFIIENMKVLNESESIKKLDNNTLRKTMEDYCQIFLEEHYLLIALNSSKARRNFNYLMFDLFIFIVLIITGLIFLNISAKASMTLFVNQLIVSVFVATVIDILKNILQAVQFEFKAHGIKES